MPPKTLALLVVAVAACSSSAQGDPKPLECRGVPARATQAAPGNPNARRAAQQGLGYLTRAAKEWTQEHKCFGCHVQAVTMEALAVGMHHQYDIDKLDVDAMAAALRLGVTAGGHTTGVAFEGQAWARYDMWVDGNQAGELARYAQELVALQQADGSVPDDDARLPVTGGTMHTTYQAMQTWRQQFARTADDKWLTPMRKAERYLAQQQWTAESYLQNINYALLGLIAAGVSPGEPSAAKLQKLLLARQQQDGGWGLDPEQSDALATGQTLYALRLAGRGDGEAAIDRGTRWLVEHQGRDGAWHTYRSGQGGADKGEAMWAVLGLVSMDVTSVAVRGLLDGQHVTQAMQIAVEARDNQAGGVSKIELFLDDRPLAGACSDRLGYEWKTGDLAEGKHILEVVATNAKARTSKRRYEVYAGNVYLTDLGTRFDEARRATEIGVRNIALSKERAGRVELAVYAAGADGKRGKRVHTSEQAGTLGAMTFAWSGGATGKYIAELTLRDGGVVVQRAETVFVHDSEAAQRAGWSEIEGNLSLRGASDAANTVVELVNEKGEVMQRVRSTAEGNYRFKSVDQGKYRVRVRKQGWSAKEVDVDTKRNAAASRADFTLW